MKIIAICGEIGSGKSTIQSHLSYKHGFVSEAFAKPLKDSVSVLFNWDRELLEGLSDKSRTFREEIDHYWSDVFGRKITPRIVLQEFGTEVIRKNLHEDFWVKSLLRRVSNSNSNIVISDCRFVNEIQAVKDIGGEVWGVYRNDIPVFDSAKHASETDWLRYGIDNLDLLLHNVGTIQHLHDKIDQELEER